MESEGHSSCSQNTQSTKEKQSRRAWTVKEEAALAPAMLDVINDNPHLKSENGFKPGFFNAVEKELKKLLPGTTLKAVPHIESKLKNWKEKWAAIHDAITQSGFSWNHDTNSIDVDDQNVWATYEKSHSKAKGLNGKSFPMYDTWCIIFGNDRATGDFSEDPQEIRNVEPEPIDHPHLDEMLNDCYYPTFENNDPLFQNAPPFNPFPTSSGNPSPSTTTSNVNFTTNNTMPERPKKKTRVDAMESTISEALGSLLAQNNAALEKISVSLRPDEGVQDLTAKKAGLWNDLMQIDMDMVARFSAHAMILRADENVVIYYNIPPEVRKHWVEAALGGLFQLK